MWYVNFTKLEKEKIEELRFILTMWYVNSITLSYSVLVINCFILTMWYVNYGQVYQVF